MQTPGDLPPLTCIRLRAFAEAFCSRFRVRSRPQQRISPSASGWSLARYIAKRYTGAFGFFPSTICLIRSTR